MSFEIYRDEGRREALLELEREMASLGASVRFEVLHYVDFLPTFSPRRFR